MFAHFDGIVAEKTADSIVLDVNGVGYALMVSTQTLSQAAPVGARMKLFSILSVREDAMELFGFATREEKRMYERLRTVSGIGPRTALAILSTLSVKDISVALVAGDAQSLARAPGVGKKTAQRLVLELRDKVDDDELTAPVSGVSIKQGPQAEAIAALMALGYQSAEAARAVSMVDASDKSAEELIFQALKGLGG